MKRLHASFVVIICFLASCASLERLVPGPAEVPVAAHQTVILEAVEGRPNGVVLRLRTDVEGISALELYRAVGDGEAQLLQELAVDEQLAQALSRGVELVDPNVRPNTLHQYQLVLVRDGEVLEASAVLDVEWSPPPPPILEFRAAATLTDAVELRWEAPAEYGAVVFRRDVLADGPFERLRELDASCRGAFVDRDVRPGGVWSYRVALSRVNVGGFHQYGPPSEEVYASTPVEPSETRGGATQEGAENGAS